MHQGTPKESAIDQLSHASSFLVLPVFFHLKSNNNNDEDDNDHEDDDNDDGNSSNKNKSVRQ